MKALLLTLAGLLASLIGGPGPPPWLDGPTRDVLVDAADVHEYRVVYQPGFAVLVKTATCAPQIELYDGAGTLVGSFYGQPGDTFGMVVMPPGGTVTNILHLFISGGAGSYPAPYMAWKGVP